MGLVVAPSPALHRVGPIGDLAAETGRRVDDPKLRFAERCAKARRVDQLLASDHLTSLAVSRQNLTFSTGFI
jgi:hypothetical protein